MDAERSLFITPAEKNVDEASNPFVWTSQEYAYNRVCQPLHFPSGEETMSSGAPCTPAQVPTPSSLFHSRFYSPIASPQPSNAGHPQTPVKQRRTKHRRGPVFNHAKHKTVANAARMDPNFEPVLLQPHDIGDESSRVPTSSPRRLFCASPMFYSPIGAVPDCRFSVTSFDSQVETDNNSCFVHPSILTDYFEIKELGSGAFGKVALYREEALGTLAAVKTILSNGRKDLYRRYTQERNILSIIRRHPHTIRLLGSWEEGSKLYLKLEYCPGGSVASLAERKRVRDERWDERELLVFVTDMCLALDALHRADIAHVDFKPENVLIDAEGRYCLADFGCSIRLDSEGRPLPGYGVHRASDVAPSNFAHSATDSPGRVVLQHSFNSFDEGDCRYLCSDMLNSKRYIKEGDLYALGMSLYELMSGDALPRQGDEFVALRECLPTMKLRARGYSDSLIQLVEMLLQENPVLRPTPRCILRRIQPPPQLLPLILNREDSAEWNNDVWDITSDAEHLEKLVKNGLVAPLDIRYAAAVVEAMSWIVSSSSVHYERLSNKTSRKQSN